jgi:hypothetical protein
LISFQKSFAEMLDKKFVSTIVGYVS